MIIYRFKSAFTELWQDGYRELVHTGCGRLDVGVSLPLSLFQGCTNYCVVDMHLEPCSNCSLCARVETSNTHLAAACTTGFFQLCTSFPFQPQSPQENIPRIPTLRSAESGISPARARATKSLLALPEPCRWFSLIRDQMRLAFFLTNP